MCHVKYSVVVFLGHRRTLLIWSLQIGHIFILLNEYSQHFIRQYVMYNIDTTLLDK